MKKLTILFISLMFLSITACAAQNNESKSRQLTLENKYLNFPVKGSAKQRLVSVKIDGKKVR
ncbi:MAG: hypothetical protein ACYSRQ_07630, partial [Planctomycetota bacterium]